MTERILAEIAKRLIPHELSSPPEVFWNNVILSSLRDWIKSQPPPPVSELVEKVRFLQAMWEEGKENLLMVDLADALEAAEAKAAGMKAALQEISELSQTCSGTCDGHITCHSCIVGQEARAALGEP